MTAAPKGYVGAGARLAWREWRCLAWLYLANLVLGLIGAAGFAAQAGKVLSQSLKAQQLVRGFDVTAFLELLLRPEVTPRMLAPTSVLLALVFALLTLFLTAGIVHSFLADEHLRLPDFFQACGAWFWRFFRLVLMTLILLGIVLGMLDGLRGLLLRWAERSPDPHLYFWVGLAALLVMLLVAMLLRLWFDLAQFYLVHSGERKVRRALPAGLRLFRRGCFRLFGIYLFITLVGWIALAAGLWVWVKWVPPQSVGLAFLTGQGILLVWLATRFWQRAAGAVWFRAHAPALAPAAPPPAAEPAPAPPAPLPQTPN